MGASMANENLATLYHLWRSCTPNAASISSFHTATLLATTWTGASLPPAVFCRVMPLSRMHFRVTARPSPFSRPVSLFATLSESQPQPSWSELNWKWVVLQACDSMRCMTWSSQMSSTRSRTKSGVPVTRGSRKKKADAGICSISIFCTSGTGTAVAGIPKLNVPTRHS